MLIRFAKNVMLLMQVKEKNKSGFCIYLGAAGGYAAEFISGGGRDGRS